MGSVLTSLVATGIFLAMALLTNMAVGIRMIAGKRTTRNMITTHKTSTAIMALSLIVSIIVAAAGSDYR